MDNNEEKLFAVVFDSVDGISYYVVRAETRAYAAIKFSRNVLYFNERFYTVDVAFDGTAAIWRYFDNSGKNQNFTLRIDELNTIHDIFPFPTGQ